MKTWVRKSLKVGVLSAGIILSAGGAAQADWNTSDNDGILTGNQVLADIDVPINVCGNALSLQRATPPQRWHGPRRAVREALRGMPQ